MKVSVTAQTNNICKGGNIGTATAVAEDGTEGAGYRYFWDDPAGQETATATGLTVGTYNVYVKDANDCQSAAASVTITEATAITGSATPVETTTPLAEDGKITGITASGGYSEATGYEYAYRKQGTTTPLTYQSGTEFNGLAPGFYDVYARNVLAGTTFDCEYLIATVEVEKPADIKGNVEWTNVDCYGETTATATATVTEGDNGPFRLRIESPDGSTVFEDYSDPIALNTPYAFTTKLAAGNYRVRAKDDNDYVVTIGNLYVTQPDAALKAEILEANITHVSCNGLSDGAVTVTVSGGTEGTGYRYAWDDPNTQITATAVNLAAGEYKVTVLDSKECPATATVKITEPQALEVTITGITNVSCNAGENGSLTATVSGGTGTMTYVWTNEDEHTTVGGNNPTVNGLKAGNYTVSVLDGHHCPAEDTKEVTEPDALELTMSSVASLCYGKPMGQASVSVEGGTEGSGYHYAWTDGSDNPVGGDEASITNIAKGTYTVNVLDGNSCPATKTVTVGEATEMKLTMSQTAARCYNTASGTATVDVEGGTDPYQSYTWKNDDNETVGSEQTATGLLPGTYTVTVIDQNGCEKSNSITVQNTTQIEPSIVSKTDAKCQGQSNGTATLTATGGAGEYTFDWGGGITGATNTALGVGTHTVIVKDKYECPVTIDVEIGEPQKLEVTASATDAYCSTVNDGTVTASATGGAGEEFYTFTWDNGQMGASLTGLPGGSYTVTVSDGNCTDSKTVTVKQATEITGGATPTAVTTPGGSDGKITVNSVTGGFEEATYEYAIRLASQTTDLTYQASTEFTGLAEGNYEVWVRNVGENFTSCAFKITQVKVNAPSDIEASLSSSPVLCYGETTGSVTVVVTNGGTPNYKLKLMNSDESATIVDYGDEVGKDIAFTFPNLTAGTYAVGVMDANHYEASLGTVTVNQPNTALNAEITEANTTKVSCKDGADGAATVTVSGGTVGEGYHFIWDDLNAQETATATGLKAGIYTVTVKDAN